jgi:uncharacterized membrane protein HdeD (DUF308 family)
LRTGAASRDDRRVSSFSATPPSRREEPHVDLPRWWVPVAVGALAIIAGILALAWPGPTLVLVGICFGVYLIFAGVGSLISAFADEAESTFMRIVEAILGIITLFAGMILVVRPGASVVTAALVLGFWFLLAGCLQLARGIAVAEHRVYNVGFGLLGIVAGIIVLAQPEIGVVTLVWIVGIALIVRGALGIGLGLGLRRLEHGGPRDAAGGPGRVEAAT